MKITKKHSVLLLSLVLTGGLFVSFSQASDTSPVPSDIPYIRLFSELNNAQEAKTANTDAKVSELSRWYKHIHSEASDPRSFSLGNASLNGGKTFAQRLTENGIWATQYRNGSYVSQANSTDNPLFYEAKDLEQNFPLVIGNFWPGDYQNSAVNNSSVGSRLTSALTSSATTVSISEITNRPSGSPSTWPFINSNDINNNGYSDSSADYISWIRINNEIMKITSDPINTNKVITFNVSRGYFGTTPNSYALDTRVLSPTYIGNKTAAGSDQGLAGSPNVNDPNKALRYSIKIWKADGYKWIASRIKNTFGTNFSGYNSIHLDVSSCSQYNNASSDGSNVFNWSDDLSSKIVMNQWGEYQKAKVAGLRTELAGLKMIGNNFFGASAQQNNSCINGMLSNTYDLAMLEHWMKKDQTWTFDFNSAMDQNFKIQNNNWPAGYWIRWNYDFNGNVEQYKRFSYGSLLLALNPSNNKYQYGGLWGASKPDLMYFYDLGTPLSQPNMLSDVAVTGLTNVYARKFNKGIALVNSGNSQVTYNLDANYFKLEVNGATSMVSGTINIPANDAIILLSPSGKTTQPPANTIKEPIRGTIDRNGNPNSTYKSIVNARVVNVNWKDLQPNSIDDPIPDNNLIDQALNAIRADGTVNQLKIRLFTGNDSPDWLKTSVGTFSYVEPQNNINANIPKYWTVGYKEAYDQLITKLANKYDVVSEIKDVTISRCMMYYAEPFVRGTSDASNRQSLVDAGYTPELDKQCHREQIQTHSVWQTTRQSLAFNPWQYVNITNLSAQKDINFSYEMMDYCRNVLGERCILENNSLRDDATSTSPLGAEYDAMYSYMKNLGPPLLFQTAAANRIGDWQATLQKAIDLGANAVELNSAYTTYNPTELANYDNALEQNPISKTIVNPEPTSLLAPKNLNATADVNTVNLNWDNPNPSEFSYQYVISYQKQGDTTWQWPGTTNASSFTITNLQQNTSYNFRVRVKYINTQNNPVLSEDALINLKTNAIPLKTSDVNNSGKVDVFDLSILLSNWSSSLISCDINNDNTVDVFDLSIMLSNWTL